MPQDPTACRIIPANFCAIASESGRTFSRKILENWYAKNGEGVFLRDESSPLDMNYFTPEAFSDIYTYQSNDPATLFRRVIRL